MGKALPTNEIVRPKKSSRNSRSASGASESRMRSGSRSGPAFPLGRDDAFAQGVDQLGAVEQAGDLRLGAAVSHVGIVEDLRERAAALVLADRVRGDPVLAARAGEEKRERVAEEAPQSDHGRILVRVKV